MKIKEAIINKLIIQIYLKLKYLINEKLLLYINKYNKKNIIYKYLLILFLLFTKIKYNMIISKNQLQINKYYLQIIKDTNLTLPNKINKQIKIGIYSFSLKYGGIERITSILINFLYKKKIFKIFLLTQKIKDNNEFIIPETIKRTIIRDPKLFNLIKEIKKKKLEIFIYQFANYREIKSLNNFKNIKIIFYNHFCFLYWIYLNYEKFKNVYKAYQNSKYMISLVPFENDYLFEKWGINSIIMNSFISYDFNNTIPSDLSTKIILMIGRIHDKLKRFELGVSAMEYIIQEIIDCKMKIISVINSNRVSFY